MDLPETNFQNWIRNADAIRATPASQMHSLRVRTGRNKARKNKDQKSQKPVQLEEEDSDDCHIIEPVGPKRGETPVCRLSPCFSVTANFFDSQNWRTPQISFC